MTTRAVAEMREWDTARYPGGFDGLHDLADREFSGAVEAGGHALFMLRGRVVGVFTLDDEADHGLRPADIDAFEDATGTAYEAPHAALPLLFTMQATGGEERGRYYTEDTPIEEVHERLSGGFTGYLELSENVLSGDYYSVYHGGRAKHVAFVGQSDRLLEDEEAFERACDEVGIYTVTAVDLDITEIPGGEDRVAGAGAGAAGAGAGAGAAGTAGAAGAAGAAAGGGPASGDGEGTGDAEDGSVTDATEGGEGATEATDASLDADIPDAGTDPTTDDGDTEPAPGTPDAHDTGTESRSRDAVPSIADTTGVETDGEAEDEAEPPSPADAPADDEIEAAVTAVESPAPDTEGDGEEGPDKAEPGDVTTGEEESDEATDPGDAASGAAQNAAALRSALEAREAEVERLESEVEQLEAELRSVRDERDDLAARVDDLETRLRDLGSGTTAPETSMTPDEALAGTSVFVRYRSKGDATLEDLSEGVSRESVVGNLQLEHHTEFDRDAVAVDGRGFDAFLEATQEYRFARWLVTDLPLEIHETGNEKTLADLYGTIPDIDRIEFGATLADDRTFDLVARDRMGEPLVVATLSDSREATDEEPIADLVRGASEVSEEFASLSGALAVTAAFFEPEALATVEDATGGSLLSRDKRESYVKLSRSHGFHLCLVEDRDDSFYLSVPEL